MAIDYCGLALDAYGISVQKCVGTRDGQLLESDDGCKYILKQSRIKPEKIICAHIATQHLRKNGFLKATPYILDKNGLPFVLYANNCYTLAPSYVSRECSLENNEDLAAAAAILADMHNCSKGFTEENAELLFREYLPLFQESHAAADIIYKDNYSDEDEIDGDESSSDSPRYFKCELGRTADTFGRRLSELKRFRKIAKKRCDIFDYEYIAVADYYCNLADNVCRQLENSSYTEVTKRYKKEGCLCHRDFTGHNVLLAADPGITR